MNFLKTMNQMFKTCLLESKVNKSVENLKCKLNINII